MAFACESVSHEPESPISFNNIMDGIEAADFPAPTPRWFAVFCFFSPVASTLTNCRVVIEDARGEPIAQARLRDVRFTAESQISRTVVGFQGVVWPYPGRYFVKFITGTDSVLAFFPMMVQHTNGAIEDVEGPDEPSAT
jgi:hypothetical protein